MVVLDPGHDSIAHRPLAEAKARVLMTDVQVLFILDLVVKRRREMGESVGGFDGCESPLGRPP